MCISIKCFFLSCLIRVYHHETVGSFLLRVGHKVDSVEPHSYFFSIGYLSRFDTNMGLLKNDILVKKSNLDNDAT